MSGNPEPSDEIDRLRHPEWRVRYGAVQSILRKRLATTEVLIALHAATSDPDGRVSAIAQRTEWTLNPAVPPPYSGVPSRLLEGLKPVRLEGLNDPDSEVRYKTLLSAGLVRPPVSPQILRRIQELFDDPDLEVRDAAMRTYPRLAPDDPPPRSVILRRLSSVQDPDELEALLEAVAQQSDHGLFAEAECRRLLHHAGRHVRQAALQALKMIRDYGGADPEPWASELIRLLHDPDPNLRQDAALFFCCMDPSVAIAAIPDLSDLCRDEDPETRTSAYSALRSLGLFARPAVPALVGWLLEAPSEERWYILHTLAQIGLEDSRYLPQLLAALQNRSLYEVDSALVPPTRDALYVLREGAPLIARLGTAARTAVPVLEGALAAAISADLQTAKPDPILQSYVRDIVYRAIEEITTSS